MSQAQQPYELSVQPYGVWLFLLKIWIWFEVWAGAVRARIATWTVAVFLAALFFAAWNAALADDAPSDDTIVNTIRCEAGRVGQQLISQGFPKNLKVIVSWTSTQTTDGSAGAGFKFFGSGLSGDLGRQELDQLSSDGLPFNLFPKNLEVCRGYNVEIIKDGVGVYDCLINKKLASLRAAVEGGSGSTGCRHQVTLSKKINGSLKLNIWGADLGPDASWGNAFVYDFVIAAPPPKK